MFMKNIGIIIILLFTGSFFTSCEDVVNVDLDTAPPRLVIDASLDWEKGTDGNIQTIKLTTTTGYYNDEIPVVSGATIYITNSQNTVFDFIENPGTGEYTCTNFIPQLNETYTLTVINNGETYTATETMIAVPEITSVEQNDEGGFFGEDIEVRFYYQDSALENNHYMIRFNTSFLSFPDYNVRSDKYFEGNEMYGIFSDEDLKANDILEIKLYGISEKYYNYMNIILPIINGGSGSGPFQTIPVNARGNLVNQINNNNYALGYFRLSEVVTLNYTIQ